MQLYDSEIDSYALSYSVGPFLSANYQWVLLDHIFRLRAAWVLYSSGVESPCQPLFSMLANTDSATRPTLLFATSWALAV